MIVFGLGTLKVPGVGTKEAAARFRSIRLAGQVRVRRTVPGVRPDRPVLRSIKPGATGSGVVILESARIWRHAVATVMGVGAAHAGNVFG
ncbi:hypothetical protein GCM10009785_31130 [Brooklawnia cerclae]